MHLNFCTYAKHLTYCATTNNIGNMSGNRCEGVASSIPALSHTFVEIDYEIISTVFLLPSAESFKKDCCQLQAKYVHNLLVNCMFKLAQEQVWLVELTVLP